MHLTHSALPPAQGLYDPALERDACGVALLARLSGAPSHDIIEQALVALSNLDHRGASGAEPDSGDGAGILLQVPDAFLRAVVPFELPPAGAYATGVVFLPDEGEAAAYAMKAIESLAYEEGLLVLGWRDRAGRSHRARRERARASCRGSSSSSSRQPTVPPEWRWTASRCCLRKRAEHALDAYFPSLSSRTIVYKGMLTTGQLATFFPDLSDERFASALALVHSRFSTNTFPSWPLAHPYRLIAHNGEINTVKGNRNWMTAREAQLATDHIPGDLSRLFPICTPGGSDSASFDEVLELLHLGGRSLPHAVLMMIPEAWQTARRHGSGPTGVLRVPLDADRAVGRPGQRLLHRRDR